MNTCKKFSILFFVGFLVIGGMFYSPHQVHAADTILTSKYKSSNNGSTVNEILWTMDENITSCSYEPGDWGVTTPGTINIVGFFTISCNGGPVLTISLNNDGNITGGTDPVITYTQAAGTPNSVVLASGPMTNKTSTVTDGAVPAPINNAATIYDNDNDGKLDLIKVVWTENISAVADGSADWSISSTGDFAGLVEGTVECNSGSAPANECDYHFTTSTVRTDTAGSDLVLSYTGTSVTDGTNSSIARLFNQGNLLDGAKPIVTGVALSNTGTRNRISFSYSEPVTVTNGASTALKGDMTTAGTVPGFGSFATTGDVTVPTTKNTIAGDGTSTLTIDLADQAGGYMDSTSITEPSGVFTPFGSNRVVDANFNQVNTSHTPTLTGTGTWDLTTPVYVLTYPKVGAVQTNGSQEVEILTRTDEAGTAYYVAVANGDPVPSAAQVIAGNNSAGAPAIDAANAAVTANTEKSFITAALGADSTDYDVYVVVKDAAGNLTAATKVDVTTPAAGSTIVSAKITSPTQFTVVYSVPVDASFTDYSSLSVDSNPATSIDSMTGSGTTTHVITFTPSVAVTTASTGTVDIAALADGGSGNTFAGAVGRALSDGQMATAIRTASQPTINISDDGGTLDIVATFDEPMNTAVHPQLYFSSSFLVDLGTLTFVSDDWTGNTIFTAHYTIDGTIPIEYLNMGLATNLAQDIAGNIMSEHVTNSVFSTDTIAPVVSSTAPVNSAQVGTNFSVAYTLSQAVADGSITFSRTGGSLDGVTHTYDFLSLDRSSGAHLISRATLEGVFGSLVSGAIYSITYYAIDAAGNIALPVANTGVLFDASIPSVNIGSPSLSSTNTGPVTFTITYSGADTVTLSNTDVTLNTTGTVTADYNVTGSGTSTRLVTISNITGDGTLGISLASGTASYIGNLSGAAGPSTTFSVDNSAPSSPVATPGAGAYTSARSVTLSSAGSTSIRFTTDGTDPATCLGGALYTSAISVASSKTIKARGCDDAGNISALGTFAYTINTSGGGGGSSGGRSGIPVSNIIPKVGNNPGLFHFTLLSKRGSRGNEIIELQKFLNGTPYNSGLVVDGKFGLKTKMALIKFQLANGLKGDGIVGPLTRAVLNK